MNEHAESGRLRRRVLRRSIALVAWGIAVAGYFGPWIRQRAAALSWNAFDLFDILRILPEIETLSLRVNLYALRLPLVGLALLLPLLAVGGHWIWRLGALCIGAAFLVNTLPPYDVLRTAWNTPGWRVPFWWSAGGLLALAALSLVGWRKQSAPRLRAWVMLAWLLLTGIPAMITLPRLLPALGRLFAAPVGAGWGFWVWGAGWCILAISFWVRGLALAPIVTSEKALTMSTQTEAMPEETDATMVALQHVQTIKARYERELLTKANVVGVGIGLSSTVTRAESLSLIVNVTHKVPLTALEPEDRIPRELEGVPVKVEAIGQPKAQS